jgi:hypothetical protein
MNHGLRWLKPTPDLASYRVISGRRWLRERLAKGDVESQTSYLSRWNSESKQIEFAIGQFYDWPETAAPDPHCEQAQEMSGL